MVGELVVTQGPDKGRTVRLEEGQTLVLGRGTDAQVQLTDPRTSRMHCRVEVDSGKVQVVDIGSKSGTFVNSKPITEKILLPGDVIRLGETDLRFQLAESTADTVSGVAPGEPLAPKPGAPRSDSLAELIGQKLSRYIVVKVIAKGSNGMVFLAQDEENDVPAALKVLWPEISSDEEQMQRFVRAMKTMMPIHHPNLVRLYAAGRSGKYCWTAMEYVDGENLTGVIERIGTAGMLDWSHGYRVAVHVARGLEEAHSHQIIHRNVTPKNIMVRKDKVVKLGDLMLAKALEGTHAEQITRPGQLIGEMAYMSPERTRSNATVDARSDIYGLGATVYALLTGRPPCEGSSLPDLINKIRNVDPAKPKKFQLSIPDLFEGVVMRMLAKRSEDRYESAAELLKDLDRVGKFHNVSV